MKVFQILMEHEENGEITKINQFATAEDDDILTITENFKRRCYELEDDLISVSEILTISEHVKSSEIAEKWRNLYLEEPND